MKTKLTNRPVEQVIAAIEALDLDPIKLKLMDSEEGQGWSREYADRMELAYKRFLMQGRRQILARAYLGYAQVR